MSTFRADGAPSRDDTCEHDYRRFEKCPHCLAAENERLREALARIVTTPDNTGDTLRWIAAEALK
jgi:hypothetical protein